jgi:hypothetical protein
MKMTSIYRQTLKMSAIYRQTEDDSYL